MNNPLPWFKVEVLQVANDLSDVRSLEGEGAYFRVLRHLWLNGPQPIEVLRRKCQHTFNELEHLFNTCSTDGEHLFSIEWIEAQRGKADEWRAKKREAGIQSGLVRASKPKTKNRRSTPVEHTTSTSTSISKESKKDTIEDSELNWPKWAGPQTMAKWDEFKKYKNDAHKFKYKTKSSEQSAINLLEKYYTGGEQCVAALDEAMGKGWKFPVEDSKTKAEPVIMNANGKPQKLKPWVM